MRNEALEFMTSLDGRDAQRARKIEGEQRVEGSVIIAIIIGWIAFSVLAGFIAQNKGRSFLWFFLASILLSPLIGVLAAWGAWPQTAEVEEDISPGNSSDDQQSVLRPSPGAVQLGRSVGRLFRK